MAAPLLQSYGPGNVDEILTTSTVNLIPRIRDNVFKSNPALDYLKNKVGIKKRGGTSFSHGILYETNTAATRYQRYDLLATTPQDGATRDQWEIAQYAVPISVDGFSERIANAGDSKIEDIVEMKMMQAEGALSLLLEQDVFAAAPAAKAIQSLPVIVASSGTVGGINGTTSTWWASTVVASGSFAAQGRSDLTNAWNSINILNPVGGPKAIFSSQSELQYYEAQAVTQERFMDSKSADLGFVTLTFKMTPWYWSPQASSGTIYLLGEGGCEFIIESSTDFLVTPFTKPADQDAKVAHILLACALTTGNRRKLAKLTGVTA